MLTTTFTTQPQPQLDASGVVSQLSGDRLLMQSRVVGPDSVTEPWTLKDLRTGQTTSLPDAISYHLWGERLARLDSDGSVWVVDLRTGAAPVQVRAPSADITDGTVLLAGDTAAWQITSSSGSTSTTELMTRNLATMAPAAPLTGLDSLRDLSTGYAVGSSCPDGGGCTIEAVPLAGGEATPIDAGTSARVDGNNLAYIATSGIAYVVPLPAYADQPWLLGAPAATATYSPTAPWTARVVTSRAGHLPDRDPQRGRHAGAGLELPRPARSHDGDMGRQGHCRRPGPRRLIHLADRRRDRRHLPRRLRRLDVRPLRGHHRAALGDGAVPGCRQHHGVADGQRHRHLQRAGRDLQRDQPDGHAQSHPHPVEVLPLPGAGGRRRPAIGDMTGNFFVTTWWIITTGTR